MFSKRNPKTSAPANMEEVHTGYMLKSPPPTLVFRNPKSWKRRFFVLARTPDNNYELKFYRDENREKMMGEIDMYEITLLFLQPDSHSLWPWIQKNFKCAPSNVLYMKVRGREYFLIGESSDEMDCWFDALFAALNACRNMSPPEEDRNRSISAPLRLVNEDPNFDQEEEAPSPVFDRHSVPTCSNELYDYPRKYSLHEAQDIVDNEEDEEDEINSDEENEAKSNMSCYMEMKNVTDIVKESQDEVDMQHQTKLDEDKYSDASLLQQVPLKTETITPEQKDVCMNRQDLKHNVIFAEKEGRPCITDLIKIPSSDVFHEGDQIMAINDLYTDSLCELQTYLKRLSKDQVKVTILRQPGSRPLNASTK